MFPVFSMNSGQNRPLRADLNEHKKNWQMKEYSISHLPVFHFLLVLVVCIKPARRTQSHPEARRKRLQLSRTRRRP